MDADHLRTVAQGLVRLRHGVALTGAGMSAESGIPTFRGGPGGLWERFDPEEYATIEAFRADPAKVWRLFFELHDLAAASAPNPGHRALARLEKDGLLDGIVTQNVDALHRRAGSRCVAEVHGAGDRAACTRCGARRPLAGIPRDFPPLCACGGILKADVVLFGEMLPQDTWAEALALCRGAATLLVVGTSALVAPASYLPDVARTAGATVVVINPEPTILDRDADVILRGTAAEILPEIARIASAAPA